MPSVRRLTLSATVVVFALLLSACVSPSPAATPEPTEAPTPTETAAPAVVGPTPVFDVGCDDLVDTGDLQAFVGAGVAPIAPVAQAERIATIDPDAAALDQLGSLVCDWSDGQQWASPWGPPPESCRTPDSRSLPMPKRPLSAMSIPTRPPYRLAVRSQREWSEVRRHR